MNKNEHSLENSKTESKCTKYVLQNYQQKKSEKIYF